MSHLTAALFPSPFFTGKRKLKERSVLPYNERVPIQPNKATAVRQLTVDEREQVFAGAYARAFAKPYVDGDAAAANRQVLGTLANGARLVIGGPGPHRAFAMFAPAAVPF